MMVKIHVCGRFPSTVKQETWATWEGQLSQLPKWSWGGSLPDTGMKENCAEQTERNYC